MRALRVVRYATVMAPLAALGVGCSSPSEVSEPARLGFDFITTPEIAELGFNRDWLTIIFKHPAGTDTIQGADFSSGNATFRKTDQFPVLPGNVEIHIDIAPEDKVVGTADLVLSVEEGDLWIVRLSLGRENPVPCFDCVAWAEVPFKETVLGLQTFWVIQIQGRVPTPGVPPPMS